MQKSQPSDDILRPLLPAACNSPKQLNQPTLSICYKVLRILSLLALWICFGAFSEVTGPVLPELIAQTRSTYSVIAQTVSMRGAGHAIGGIIGGLAVDHWFHHIDILVSFWLLVYTGISVATAYVQSAPLLYFVFLSQGSTETFLQTAGYRIILKTWKEKAAGPIHALHTGYGIGSLVIPQLVAPFLDPRFSGGTIVTSYNSSCRRNTTPYRDVTTPFSIAEASPHFDNYNRSHAPVPHYPAKFVTVYWILAGYSLIIGLIFVIYHIYGKATGIKLDANGLNHPSHARTLKNSISFQSCSPTKPRYAAGIIFTLFFYYVVGLPLVRAFSKFVYSYARDGPCLSVQDSVSLETAYFTAITVGRFAAFVSATFIHMKYILQVEVFGVLACALVLCFLHEHIWILWTFVTALGFFTGPILPSAFAWANRYIEVTSVAQIVPQIGAAVGDVAVLSALGHSYEETGPYAVWYYMLILSVSMVVIAGVIQVFGSLHGDRHKDEK